MASVSETAFVRDDGSDVAGDGGSGGAGSDWSDAGAECLHGSVGERAAPPFG